MSNYKKELNKTNDDTIRPVISGTMEHLYNESLMLFSKVRRNNKNYRLFYGIGMVYRVVKGKSADLVHINFGIFNEQNRRVVVVIDNHARRQLMTLKRGQICQIYGLARYYTGEVKINGEKKKGVRLGLYAKAINGWYVPTSFDIKKMPVNEDLDEPTEGEQKLFETFDDVLEQFLNGEGEEE